MRLDQLSLDQLFEDRPKGGVMRFAGRRTLLLDAVALGLLRSQLIELVGQRAARGILTRLGYAHGTRTARTMRLALPWDSQSEWQRAGGRLHQLQGLVEFEPLATPDGYVAAALWRESYEAEQHLLHLGQSEEPTCWSLCGFASGYLSSAHDQEIYAFEAMCVGRGDSHCKMLARRREDGDARIEAELSFYERDCLDEALRAIQEQLHRSERRLSGLRGRSDEVTELAGMVARSRTTRQTVRTALRLARYDSSIIICGEPGTGKRTLARTIHNESPRATAPFVDFRVGGAPAELAATELWGRPDGSSARDRLGAWGAAKGGTLYIDELTALSPSLQARLLARLESQPGPRLIAATAAEPDEAVQKGTLLPALYYRARVGELHLAPLRERVEDLVPLAERFIAEVAGELGLAAERMSPGARRAVLGYHWPGNARELRSAIERAAVLTAGREIDAEHLPAELTAPPTVAGDALADVERAHILAVLERAGGNRAEAARRLGIGEATLYRRLRRYREER